ncbi:MAG: MBL fold metallo-hydrolase [Paracoccaceae bacterium]|nr:MBL fold metallo-hydrolase [Paracoccaceae bacterium]
MINRRTLIAGLSAPFIVTMPGIARAVIGGPNGEQSAGFTRFTLGDFEITVVSDGNLATPANLLGVNAEDGDLAAFLESRFLDTITNYAHTNHVIINTGDAMVLVDVGSGDKFQQTAGQLLNNLEAAEIDPSDITHVALTHAHPDHIWGMMDDFGDEPRFPEATYAMGATEYDWWMKDGRVADVPDAMKPFVVGAQNALSPVAERVSMMVDGGEVTPGVRMIATPGHTLGHMSVVVESAGESLLVLGDAINHAHISFERPNWQFGLDMDKEQAVTTRNRLLDMAASERMAVSGYHLPFPGVGHVARDGEAYRFVPALVRWGQ